MKNQEIFSIIRNEFTEEIAVNATILILINKTLMPYNEEMVNNGLYVERLKSQYVNVLWQLDKEKQDLCMKIWDVWHIFEIGHDMDGLGGCKKKTLKELIGIEQVDEPLTSKQILDNMDR